jgi:hypothetical protein
VLQNFGGGRAQTLFDCRWRNAGRKAYVCFEPGGLGPIDKCAHGNWSEEVRHPARFGAGKAFVHHAHDLEEVVSDPVFAPDFNALPDHVRIAPEPPRPVVPGEEGDGMRTRLQIVASGDEAPQSRPQPEGGEHPPGNVLHIRFFQSRRKAGAGLPGQVHPVDTGDADQLRRALHSGAQLPEVRVVQAVDGGLFATPAISQLVQPFRIRDRQRLEQQRVDQPEGRCAGSDRQPKRQNCRSRSDLSFHELPPAENGIGAERIEPWGNQQVAARFAVLQRGAKSSAGCCGVVAVLDRFIDVRRELFVEIANQTIAAKDICNPRRKRHITPSSERGLRPR